MVNVVWCLGKYFISFGLITLYDVVAQMRKFFFVMVLAVDSFVSTVYVIVCAYLEALVWLSAHPYVDQK